MGPLGGFWGDGDPWGAVGGLLGDIGVLWEPIGDTGWLLGEMGSLGGFWSKGGPLGGIGGLLSLRGTSWGARGGLLG